MPGVICHKCGDNFDAFDPRIEYVREGNSTKPQCKGYCGQELDMSVLGEAEQYRVEAYEEFKRNAH